ncbi:hypothetical protein [Sphingobium yanoikuyae]|uniref:hypothetical protein n=1 Tax=Sphingobium yanoikuyae TaxID=13690 RepID=UPI001F28870B|nr:hypothetical protein [Sphingobium yanoikuyae]
MNDHIAGRPRSASQDANLGKISSHCEQMIVRAVEIEDQCGSMAGSQDRPHFLETIEARPPE